MAIQVSGTQVIGNSRELTNIASVDATTAAAIGAAGVGGGDAPTPPNWLSPTATVSSTGTWSKPGSIGNDDWVVFYLVGGGGGWGEYNAGGGGGSAVIVSMKGSVIPSSVPMTIGNGGGPNQYDAGDNTTMTISGTVVTAGGGAVLGSGGAGQVVQPRSGIFSVPSDGTQLGVALGSGTTTTGAPAAWDTRTGSANRTVMNQVFGGAAGGSSGFGGSPAPGGVSTYAGNGGNGGSLTVQNGTVPGGGAGGTAYPVAVPNTTGGKGSVRIYW